MNSFLLICLKWMHLKKQSITYQPNLAQNLMQNIKNNKITLNQIKTV